MGAYKADEEFGGGTGGYRTVAVGTAIIATLEVYEIFGDEWVPVPDSALTGPTVITFYCQPGLRYRWGSVTADKGVTMSGSSGRAGG